MSAALDLQPAPWSKFPKQVEAVELLNETEHTLLYGGSRSSKTEIILRQIFLRASFTKSRHLIVRLRFNHAKMSLWYDSIPKMIDHCFPGSGIQDHKGDFYYTVPAETGGESTVWIGGTDDKDRMEKLLGNEYSSVYMNEVSQLSWEAVPLLWTKMCEPSGLRLRAYYDCNPPAMKHWVRLLFWDGTDPKGEKLQDDEGVGINTGRLLMNPKDNPHLPKAYLRTLDMLPLRHRQRFRDGLFLTDVEGALWTDEMVMQARAYERKELQRVTVAVDPSVAKDGDRDECGIVICGKDEDGVGGVLADWSGNLSTATWAKRVVNAYHEFKANDVVAEGNQGGQLVADAIHNVDGGAHIKVTIVHARHGKHARAEPVSMLYETGKAWHDMDMPELEEELTTYVPKNTTKSPGRLDATVWGITHLVLADVTPVYHFR